MIQSFKQAVESQNVKLPKLPDILPVEKIEVFMRITNNRKGAEKHLNRIKAYIPDTGTVRIIRLTEKQFSNMGLYQTEEDCQESIVGVNDYMML